MKKNTTFDVKEGFQGSHSSLGRGSESLRRQFVLVQFHVKLCRVERPTKPFLSSVKRAITFLLS